MLGEGWSMMKLMARVLSCIAALFRLFPLKDRVAFLSRQSGSVSLDYSLLSAGLSERYPHTPQILCLTDPETGNILNFAMATFKQMWYSQTSRVCIVDGYVPAVSIPKKRQGVLVIQLWHALGAVKRFSYQSLDTPAGRTSESARIARMHGNYDYVIAGGPGAVGCFAEAFHYGEEAIVPLGLPRMDYLLNPDPASVRRQNVAQIKNKYPHFCEGEKHILYAPTLRKGEGYEGWLTDYIKDLAQHCPENTSIIITGHPLNRGFDEALLDEFPCLKYAPGLSTIDLLELADCVITDYSAVTFEAALLGKPVFFYVPDIDIYRESPGLNIDPGLLFSDFTAKSADDLMKKCDNVLSCGLTNHNAFTNFMDAYFKGCGYGSVERLISLIESTEAGRLVCKD